MCDETLCPVHQRIDMVEEVRANEPARAITYLGEYCVTTVDNPNFMNPMVVMSAVLSGEPMPDMFLTAVVRVGDRAVGDVPDDDWDNAVVFQQTFVSVPNDRLDGAKDDEFLTIVTELFKDGHQMTVDMVKAGAFSES